MASKYFSVLAILILTWACLFQTTLGAAGWCYQCDERNSGCQLDLDAVVWHHHRVPCSGQCYIRVKDGLMSRGCSWEYGFMARQTASMPIFELDSVWLFAIPHYVIRMRPSLNGYQI